jgi:tetratricopeptide (TPR) repeat protein
MSSHLRLVSKAGGIEFAPRLAVQRAREIRRAGDVKTAAAILDQLYHDFPLDPHIWHEMAMLALTVREYEKADGLLKTVVGAIEQGLLPPRPEPFMQLGVLHERFGDYETALVWYRKALGLHKALKETRYLAVTYAGLAGCLYRLGRSLEGWDQWVRKIRVLARQHGTRFAGEDLTLDSHSAFVAGLVMMAAGEWVLGWALYEERLNNPEQQANTRLLGVSETARPARRWDGRSEGRVLILPEQGLGDILMMLRYVEEVRRLSGVAPIVVVPVPLAALAHRLYGDSAIVLAIPVWNKIPALADFYIECMSLPLAVGHHSPFEPLKLDGEGWQPQPMRLYKRIGLCWHGSRDHANDKDRSAPSRDVMREPLLAAGYEVVSLQEGEDGFAPDTFLDTADVMRTLDVVVTVDTAVAHLAGTLGVPTIVIPPTPIDWRWPIRAFEDQQTPWYRSVRVVRRARTDDWQGAMERAVSALAEIAAP